jgi:hypothetical protein
MEQGVFTITETMELTQLLWTLSVPKHSPLFTFQSLIVLSSDAEAIRIELCEKSTELTDLLWPLSVRSHSPLLASQSLTVLSLDPEAS